MQEKMSFYIPRVSFNTTEEFMKKTLNEIGKVECVVFKKVKKINTYRKVKCAIVYFSEYYENILSLFIKQCIESGKSYNYYTSNDRYEFWILLKNKKNLNRTNMNNNNNNNNNNNQIENYCKSLEKK